MIRFQELRSATLPQNQVPRMPAALATMATPLIWVWDMPNA